MLSERELSAAIGKTAYDGSGAKIGMVEHFFVDDRTGAPTWVAVATGLFGTSHSVVPAADASFTDGALRLPVSVDAVKSAPDVSGDHLDPGEEAELRRHYGLERGSGGLASPPADARTEEMRVIQPPVPEAPEPTGTTSTTGTIGATTAGTSTIGAGAAGPTTTGATTTGMTTTGTTTTDTTTTDTTAAGTDGAMTRSEEQLRVGTHRIATTRARLVKYVVTEEVQITVPIRREEIRVEEVPVGADDSGIGESLVSEDDAYGEPSSGARTVEGGLPDEIILHTERPVVTVEVVPTERVRLRTEVVQGQDTVTEQVQREQIVVDQDMAAGAGPTTARPDGSASH